MEKASITTICIACEKEKEIMTIQKISQEITEDSLNSNIDLYEYIQKEREKNNLGKIYGKFQQVDDTFKVYTSFCSKECKEKSGFIIRWSDSDEVGHYVDGKFFRRIGRKSKFELFVG